MFRGDREGKPLLTKTPLQIDVDISVVPYEVQFVGEREVWLDPLWVTDATKPSPGEQCAGLGNIVLMDKKVKVGKLPTCQVSVDCHRQHRTLDRHCGNVVRLEGR